MGDLVLIEDARAAKEQELQNQREHLANHLDQLAARARAGEIIGVCVASIPSDRKAIGINALKTEECGSHELVGASAILSTYIASTVSQ